MEISFIGTTHTPTFHNRWEDNTEAYPALVPDTHVYWTQVCRSCNDDTNDWFEIESDVSDYDADTDDGFIQVHVDTTIAIEELISATRFTSCDMA